jgi:hypothetical protein
MESTYLSIDLDFWDELRTYTHLRKFLKKVKRTTDNIEIVDSHESLKPHVNKSHCQNLINVDFHSDICDINFKKERLNCGNWVNYVNTRFSGNFIWIHPHPKDCLTKGYCHDEYAGDEKIINPFVNPQIANWNHTKKIFNHTPEKFIPWDSVTAVGIAFSYYWLRLGENDGIVEVAKEVFDYRPPYNHKARFK